MQVQAWFHKTMRGGRYQVGTTLFLVGADGALTPTPPQGSETERRLCLNPQVDLREVPVPAAPPPPSPPVPSRSTPAQVQADQASQKAWFHKTLRGGRYSVGGFVFHVMSSGRLLPPAAPSLADRLTANPNVVYRDVAEGEDAAYPVDFVQQAQGAPGVAPPPPMDATFEADVGDFAQMRRANADASRRSLEALAQFNTAQTQAPVPAAEPVAAEQAAAAPVTAEPVATAPVVAEPAAAAPAAAKAAPKPKSKKADEAEPAADKPKSKRGENLAKLNAQKKADQSAVQE